MKSYWAWKFGRLGWYKKSRGYNSDWPTCVSGTRTGTWRNIWKGLFWRVTARGLNHAKI